MEEKTRPPARFDGKCDKAIYPLELGEEDTILSVSYLDMEMPREQRRAMMLKRQSYFVKDNAQLTPTISPPDLFPDSEIAAFWFLRSCYEHLRKPVFFYYQTAKKLIVFPPVAADGDQIVIQFRPPLPEAVSVIPFDEESNSF